MPRPLALLPALAAALLLAALAAAPAIAAVPAPFSVHGSVEQVYVTGMTGSAPLELVDAKGRVLATRRPDRLGALLFRGVPSGGGYRVRRGWGRTAQQSGPLRVLGPGAAPPSTAIYRQRLPMGGYGYLATRDGTTLAIDVRLPLAGGPGPYPTLVEYAGYGYADPYHGPDSGIAEIAQALGFAVVDVNMRGTGCSGGAFDYFERLQSLDGYDVVETVARQPWVLGHRVGLLGISYGGITQLFVGATAPPHLAAISPLSVIDNGVSTLYPGGILNTGFAVTWARERDQDAQAAAPGHGQPWAYQRILAGDRTCRANQALHPEASSLVARIRRERYYTPALDDAVNPATFVHRITAPVFLACQFTDEQTGGHCPALVEHMTGSRHRWFTFTNGVHGDSLDPATLNRLYDFLELYVARAAPHLSPVIRAFAPAIWSTAFGISGVTLPSDPIQSQPTYAAALAAFQRLPEVRVLFDNGAGSANAGYPYPAFERSFSRFPIPGTHAGVWYLGAGGTLGSRVPRAAGAERFGWDPAARAAVDYSGPPQTGGLWAATPAYRWTQNPAGTALSYVTAPLRHDTVVVGAGALEAWVRASVPDVDLQVTVTEVRPDGRETFVQNGWLRTSLRALDRRASTPLEPVLSLSGATVAPLPAGRFTALTIPLYYEGHVYRRGSRIRIILSAPGGDQPIWRFAQLVPAHRATVWLGHGPAMPSRLLLPVISGVSVPAGLPPCPGLRGEPCRRYRPLRNPPA